MEREFPQVLSVKRMLLKDRQPRNLCVFEWLNIDATAFRSIGAKNIVSGNCEDMPASLGPCFIPATNRLW